MESNQITLPEVYKLIKKIEEDLIQIKTKLNTKKDDEWDSVKVFADEKLLGETWLSKEDEEAFAYLQ